MAAEGLPGDVEWTEGLLSVVSRSADWAIMAAQLRFDCVVWVFEVVRIPFSFSIHASRVPVSFAGRCAL